MKFLNRVGSQSPRAGPNAARGVKTTMKPIPYRELDLPIGNVPTGFRNPRVAFASGRGQRRRGVALRGLQT
jgi:hypothetical protein